MQGLLELNEILLHIGVVIIITHHMSLSTCCSSIAYCLPSFIYLLVLVPQYSVVKHTVCGVREEAVSHTSSFWMSQVSFVPICDLELWQEDCNVWSFICINSTCLCRLMTINIHSFSIVFFNSSSLYRFLCILNFQLMLSYNWYIISF